ncbi:2OG-Fe(II) oxygenase [Agarilytica rhodophyticola]|uniref:2OG-Fe(II) oxygenase n=1 Tax=Agarilytica rhodophyticola TaxID=1737490 RepID=UPI000B341A70|nr:2OG-Fe(II) oxygenase [Agarilytica rhodophyticola]
MPSSPDQNKLFEYIAQEIYEKGFCICENALPEKLSTELLNEVLQSSSTQFTQAGIGRANDYGKNSEIRRDSIAWIDSDSDAGKHWLQWVDGLKIVINRHLMLGLFSFESHFAVYQPGDFYKKHFDAFRGKTNRKLSVVTYLNKNWQSELGGELILYAKDGEQVLSRVCPAFGTLAIFLSEEFPHEVLSASRQRYSIAGWFHVRDY